MAITTEATRISARDIPLWSRSNAYTRWIMSWARDSSREGDGDGGGGAGRRVGEREGCRGKGSAQIAEDDISRGGQRESLRQGHHAAGVGPRPHPDGAAAPGEAHAHLGGRGELHADIVVLLDGEPARLIEKRHNLLGAGPCRRRLVVGDEERNGHHGQEADDGADDDELCHAVASAADARESPAGASRTDRHDRAISSMGRQTIQGPEAVPSSVWQERYQDLPGGCMRRAVCSSGGPMSCACFTLELDHLAMPPPRPPMTAQDFGGF